VTADPNTTQDPRFAEAEKLRAQAAELRAKRQQREAEQAPALELEAAQRELREEQALQDAIDAHGQLGVALATVQTSMGLVIVKRASAIRFRRFQDKGDAQTEDVLALVRPCVVYPSAAELDVILNDLPATLTLLASAVITLAGQGGANLIKKS
jgi:hypothetical protein